jgi:hypothetical protein
VDRRQRQPEVEIVAMTLVLMPPPRPALSLPCADEVSGSAARAAAMTRFRARTGDTSPRPGCSSRR